MLLIREKYLPKFSRRHWHDFPPSRHNALHGSGYQTAEDKVYGVRKLLEETEAYKIQASGMSALARKVMENEIARMRKNHPKFNAERRAMLTGRKRKRNARTA